MNLVIVVFNILIFNVCGEVISNYDYEEDLDSIIQELYDNNIFDYARAHKLNDNEKQPVFLNGIWKCGNCSNVDESKLLYGESLELGTNYNDFGNIETQIGFALNNMKCIIIEADESSTISRVSGSCEGDEVVLSILAAFETNIKIY